MNSDGVWRLEKIVAWIKGVFERVLHSRTGATLLDNGKFRLWLFSKLYRELLKAGPVAASRAAKLGGTVATVGFPNIGLQGFATSERDG